MSKAYRYRYQAGLGPRAGSRTSYKAAPNQAENLGGLLELQFVPWCRGNLAKEISKVGLWV